jgi:hypothetical protein
MVEAVGSVDGTKFEANASKHAAVTYAWAGKQLELRSAGVVLNPAEVIAHRLKTPLAKIFVRHPPQQSHFPSLAHSYA